MAIYDCFTFFNELDLLKIRLEQYYDIVDKFVIVECAYTQQGAKKDFNFENNKTLYTKYLDKIIYIKVEDVPEYKKIYEDKLNWYIENFQRNQILRGLINCTDEDIVIISDIDEFIKPKVIKNLFNQKIIKINKENNFKDKIKQFLEIFCKKNKLIFSKNSSDFLEYSPIAIQMNVHPYYMNAKEDFYWYGTVICKFKNLIVPQSLRNKRNNLPYIKDAGYHFSYLGGTKKIALKLKNIIEGVKIKIKENQTIEEYVEECLKNGIDIWNPKMSFYKMQDEKIELDNIEKIKKENPEFFLD